MISLIPVIQRLKAATTPSGHKLLRAVGGSISYAAATKPGFALGDGPNAYVIPVADQPKSVPPNGGPQVIDSDFQVQLFLRLHGDQGGSSKEEELVALEDGLLGCLLNWKPAPHLGPLAFVRGGLSDFSNQELWWGMVFRTVYGLLPKGGGQ